MPAAPVPTVLDRLLEISELFQHDIARAFEGTSLTAARVRVLWELQHSGPMTQQALASRLEVSARNVTGLVDALEAGAYVARVFAIEARISLALGIVLMLIERRIARDAVEAGGRGNPFSAQLLLPAGALFCTIAGYYGLQPLMADARSGSGAVSFAALHGASLALFGIKGLAVLALGWITQRRVS